VTRGLALLDIHKRFGRVTALDGASLHVRPDTVHAVLGENGAGKSTLMRVAFGLVRPDAGRVQLDGRSLLFRSPADALAAGVGMVHQHFSLVPAMTVADNVSLGLPRGLRRHDPRHLVEEAAARTGLHVPANAVVDTLGVGAQQRVEILKAIVRDVRLLILDEPTAVLTPGETDDLLEWIRSYARDGRAVVLITHKLREAQAIADDVTVLRGGRSVWRGKAEDTTEVALVRAMLGGDDDALAKVRVGKPRDAAPDVVPSPVVLGLHDVTVPATPGGAGLHGVTLEVRAGEILGLAAVEGTGQHELLRVLAGRLTPASGRVHLPGEVAFIAEDRHRDALMLEGSLTENVALRGLGHRRGTVNWQELRQRACEVVDIMRVQTPSVDVPIRQLSGGNQQRFVLGREFTPLPAAVVAENPTRGLDLQATHEVHQRLIDAAGKGAAVVVYSSDVDEVLSLASRVAVVFQGSVIAVDRHRDAVGRAMLLGAAGQS
jgi:simple sugar transport system ATP-binding protein